MGKVISKVLSFFWVFVLLMVPVCLNGQELMWTRIQNDQGQLLEDYQVLKKKKKVKHGIYHRYYKNGQVNIEGNYADGLLHGEWKSLHYDGGVAVSGAYLYGQWDSTWTYYDVDSTLCVQGDYKDNQRTGIWSFLGDGGYLFELDYQGGVPDGGWLFKKKDSLLAKCSVQNGVFDPESFELVDYPGEIKDTVYTVPEIPAIFYMLNYNNPSRMTGPGQGEPMFASKMDAINRYMQNHVRLPRSVFPTGGTKARASQTCYMQILINQCGLVEGVSIIRSFNKDLDKELRRVLMAMPPWIPAINEGIPVKSMITIPYKFQIRRM